MAGSDMEKSLLNLVKKITGAKEENMPTVKFLAKLNEWEANEAAINEANEHEDRNEALHDRCDAMRAVCEGTAGSGEVQEKLKFLFSRPASLITLSSIHRAKGLEWDTVVHLDPWRLPSKWAKRSGGEALRQEWNLKYVCETRTRARLVEANMEDFR